MYSFVLIANLSFLWLLSLNSEDTVKRVINYLLIIVIGSLFVFNRQNHDYEGYLRIFENPDGYVETGYALLVKFIKKFNGNHNHILMILGLLVSVTWYRLIKLSNYLGFALLCYMIFPMVIDIIQIRNTFSMYFLFNALIEYSKNRKTTTFLFLAIGSSFHHFGFIYFILFALMIIGKIPVIQSRYKIFFLLTMVISHKIIEPGLSVMENYQNARTFSSYVADELKVHSIIIWGLPVLMDLLLMTSFLKGSVKNKNEQFVKLILLCISLSLIFFGGLLYLYEFNRFYRTFFVLKYVIASLMLSSLKKTDRVKLIAYVLISASLFGLYYDFRLNYDYVLFNVL